MRRIHVAVALLLAAFIAVEPVVHTHPLVQRAHNGYRLTAGGVCTACAARAGQIAQFRPAVAAPLPVSFTIAVTTAAFHSGDGSRPAASRAPPVCA